MGKPGFEAERLKKVRERVEELKKQGVSTAAERRRLIESEGLLEKLLEKIEKENDVGARVAAVVRKMPHPNAPNAVEELIEKLKDRDFLVRREAVWQLGIIGDKRAVSALKSIK